MSTLEQYNDIFIEVFEVNPEQLESLVYQCIPAWDSVGHMTMITQIEDAFDIMIDAEDIIEFSSWRKGMDILRKYDVSI